MEEWFAEIFLKLSEYGEIEKLYFIDNTGDHLIGNIMVKFTTEEFARSVKENISRRKFRGHLVMPEFSHVEDFERGSCGDFPKGLC